MLSATPRGGKRVGRPWGVTNVHGAQTDPMARRRRGIPVVLNEALGGNIADHRLGRAYPPVRSQSAVELAAAFRNRHCQPL